MILNSLLKRVKMKKFLLFVLFGVASAISANTIGLSEEQFGEIVSDCFENKNKLSCQSLIDVGLPISVEKCTKENCNELGVLYALAENYYNAAKYYKRAGELGDAIGYSNLGFLYENGQGVRQNLFEALKLCQKSCDMNFAAACYNAGILYENGQGTRQNLTYAKKLYEKACKANFATACNNLGSLYGKGRGVKQNRSVARKYYGKACDLGEQIGCDNYREYNEFGVR